MFYHSRYVPINISNLVVLPDYIKTHAHLTKIGLMNFLEI